MAAASYYNQTPNVLDDHDRQHLLSSSGLSSGQPSPPKPLHGFSHNEPSAYSHDPSYEYDQNSTAASRHDAALKNRIRRFRIVSRSLAFLISVAVLVPITMTLIKFIQTKNTYRDVRRPDGTIDRRTAWAKDNRAWPTWMYFGVAAVSVLLNFATVFSYKFGVEQANVASYVTSLFTWVVMIGNLVVWSIAAGMYRRQKDKGEKPNDVWGWTCSAAARKIQKEFAGDVDFNQYCNVQSASWYIGLLQVGAALLTIAIYIMVFMRQRSKKNLKQQMRLSGVEPSRH